MGMEHTGPLDSESEERRREREIADVSEQLAEVLAAGKSSPALITRLRELMGPEAATKRLFVLESLLTDDFGDLLTNETDDVEGKTWDGEHD